MSARDRMGEAEDTSRSIRDRRFRYTRHLHPDRSPMGHTEYPDNLWTWKELRRLFAQEAQQQLAFGEPPSILTDLQRSIVAASKRAPAELYDVANDPHEEHNLAGLPEYADVQQRLADALEAWLAEVGDLGRRPEQDLLADWRPDGERPRTAEPEVECRDGLVAITCPTDGSIIGWTTDSPTAERRRWQLYTAPFTPPAPIWVKTWRLGFQPCADVPVSASAR